MTDARCHRLGQNEPTPVAIPDSPMLQAVRALGLPDLEEWDEFFLPSLGLMCRVVSNCLEAVSLFTTHSNIWQGEQKEVNINELANDLFWYNKQKQQKENETMATTICGIELKSGMVLELRDGEFVQVFMDSRGYTDHIYSGPKHWGSFENFNEHGSFYNHPEYDVMAIYKPDSNYDMRLPFGDMQKTEIWRCGRPEVKEMTVAEISKELGYDVKVVK